VGHQNGDGQGLNFVGFEGVVAFIDVYDIAPRPLLKSSLTIFHRIVLFLFLVGSYNH
jgi:hypothetical protein